MKHLAFGIVVVLVATAAAGAVPGGNEQPIVNGDMSIGSPAPVPLVASGVPFVGSTAPTAAYAWHVPWLSGLVPVPQSSSRLVVDELGDTSLEIHLAASSPLFDGDGIRVAQRAPERNPYVSALGEPLWSFPSEGVARITYSCLLYTSDAADE